MRFIVENQNCSIINPPEIKQNFDSTLLLHPIPKLYEDCEKVKKVFQYIEKKLYKKAKRDCDKEKYEKLKLMFLEEYGRTFTKEENYETKTCYGPKEPLFYFKISHSSARRIWQGIRYRT